jgi:hypothetical protein
MSKVNPLRVIASHEVNYTDTDGNPQTREFRTSGPNGAMKIHPGGSVFLGMLTLLVGIATPHGEIIQTLNGICARIRVDGEVVVEPTLRAEEWFDDSGESRKGKLIFDLVGDESRVALAAAAVKGIPALAKRVKSARAALAKRAA